MRFAPQLWWRRRPAVAAAIATGVLAVSAGIYALMPQHTTQPPTTATATTVVEQHKPQYNEKQIARLEFTDSPLPEVVKSIEQTYGVTIEGYDENSELRLTLSYEGTAADIVETINLTLGTELKIKQ